MTIGKFLNPKNDLAFKRIFWTEKNKDILIHFLNDIFGRTTNPIETVKFLKTDQDPKIESQRVSAVDVMCQDLEGNKFIVEIQIAPEKGFEHRAQYYAAKTYIEQREQGINYQDLKEVTFLAITEFNLFPNKNTYLSHHQLLDIETYERDLKDFSFSFLELPKFKKPKSNLMTMTEKWAYFFKNAAKTEEKDLDEIIGDDLIIKRAYEELNRFSWSTEELRIYDNVDMRQSAYEAVQELAFDKGMEQGIVKGATEEKINIARAMKKKGMGLDMIVETTGLPEEEIKVL